MSAVRGQAAIWEALTVEGVHVMCYGLDNDWRRVRGCVRRLKGPGGRLHARVMWLSGPQKRLFVAVPPLTRPARGVCCGDQRTTRLQFFSGVRRDCNQGSKERMKCENCRGVTQLHW